MTVKEAKRYGKEAREKAIELHDTATALQKKQREFDARVEEVEGEGEEEEEGEGEE